MNKLVLFNVEKQFKYVADCRTALTAIFKSQQSFRIHMSYSISSEDLAETQSGQIWKCVIPMAMTFDRQQC